MPSLVAVFTGDIKDLERKMKLLEEHAKRTGQKIKLNLKNPEGKPGDAPDGLPNAGALREALVLIREISRGNWTRVPGSASILVSRLGALKYILNPVVGITAAIAAGFYLIWRNTKKWTDQLESFGLSDFAGKFIAKQEQTWNMVTMALKETNKEITRTIELYRSAEQVAKRDMEAIREKYNHLRRMNDFTRGPGKQDRELALNAAEHNEIINSKTVERLGLLEEEKKKRREANAIQVQGAKAVENQVELAKQKAENAKKWLDENKKFEAEHKGSILGGTVPKGVKDEIEATKKRAHDAIKEETRLQQYQADNNERIKDRAELEKEANEAAKKAKEIELQLPDLKKQFAQKEKDEAEEAAAQAKFNTKMIHGSLTSLQKVGAFAPEAVLIDVNKKMHHELKAIRSHLEKGGAFTAPARGMGGARF